MARRELNAGESLVGFEELGELRRIYFAERMGLLLGTFDLLHPGHINILRHVGSLSDVVVVGVWSDELVRADPHKGSERPINPAEDRVALVSELKPVDHAFLVPSEYLERPPGTIASLQALHPDLHTIGSRRIIQPFEAGEFTCPDGHTVEIDYYSDYAQRIHSTSAMVARILDGRPHDG